VATILAVSAVFLFGVGAFAVDVGKLMAVRNELQNAADAAALSGASYLFPTDAAGKPNWALARAKAVSAIGLNTSEGSSLTDGRVDLGYWDFSARSFSTDTGKAPTVNDLPAVRVTVSRETGQNSGPVEMVFGRILGIDVVPARAGATAVISQPVSAGSGALAPFAISSCMLNGSGGTPSPYWDTTTQQPKLIGGRPIEFVIASGAASAPCGTCNCGQWTTFDTTNNAASYVRDLIQNGNASPVDIGQNTYIQPGTEATLYGAVQTYLVGKNVVVPIVGNGSLNNKGFTPVLGYACLRIDAGIQGGNKNKVCSEFPLGTPIPLGGGLQENKCIIGHFSTEECAVPGSSGGGGGPFTGTYVPPRLVQ